MDISQKAIEYKLILLGDSNVGKTSLFRKICTNVFEERTVTTLGCDVMTVPVTITVEKKFPNLQKENEFEIFNNSNRNSNIVFNNSKSNNNQDINDKEEINVDIKLYDTAGNERYRSLTKSYFTGSDGLILMYDITQRDSFENIRKWLNSIQELLGDIKKSRFIILVIGNKKDLVESKEKERKVYEDEVIKRCEGSGVKWGGEISVKNDNKDIFIEILTSVVKDIYKKIGEDSNNSENNRKFSNNSNKKNNKSKKKCC